MLAVEERGRGLGALALELVNTHRSVAGAEVDRVRTPDELRSWLSERGLLADVHFREALRSPVAARLLLTELQRLRTEVRRLVQAYALGSELPERALFGVNRVLEGGRTSTRLERSGPGLRLETKETARELVAVLVPVARSAAELVTGVPPSRIRRCASESCRLWFVDTSKGGRRKWCSMARCGNRAKAAKHRRKQAAVEES